MKRGIKNTVNKAVFRRELSGTLISRCRINTQATAAADATARCWKEKWDGAVEAT